MNALNALLTVNALEPPIINKYYEILENSLPKLIENSLKQIIYYNVPASSLLINELQQEVLFVYEMNTDMELKDILKILQKEFKIITKNHRMIVEECFLQLERQSQKYCDAKVLDKISQLMYDSLIKIEEQKVSKKTSSVIAPMLENSYYYLLEVFEQVQILLKHLCEESILPYMKMETIKTFTLNIILNELFINPTPNKVDMQSIIKTISLESKSKFVYSSFYEVELRKKIVRFQKQAELRMVRKKKDDVGASSLIPAEIQAWTDSFDIFRDIFDNAEPDSKIRQFFKANIAQYNILSKIIESGDSMNILTHKQMKELTNNSESMNILTKTKELSKILNRYRDNQSEFSSRAEFQEYFLQEFNDEKQIVLVSGNDDDGISKQQVKQFILQKRLEEKIRVEKEKQEERKQREKQERQQQERQERQERQFRQQFPQVKKISMDELKDILQKKKDSFQVIHFNNSSDNFNLAALSNYPSLKSYAIERIVMGSEMGKVNKSGLTKAKVKPAMVELEKQQGMSSPQKQQKKKKKKNKKKKKKQENSHQSLSKEHNEHSKQQNGQKIIQVQPMTQQQKTLILTFETWIPQSSQRSECNISSDSLKRWRTKISSLRL